MMTVNLLVAVVKKESVFFYVISCFQCYKMVIFSLFPQIYITNHIEGCTIFRYGVISFKNSEEKEKGGGEGEQKKKQVEKEKKKEDEESSWMKVEGKIKKDTRGGKWEKENIDVRPRSSS